MRTMTLADFHAACRAQGVPDEHIAVKCPICGTVQSLADLKAAHAAATPEHLRAHFGPGTVEPALHLGFSCIGRFTGAGDWRGASDTPGRGCNWTLGGFLKAHTLEVLNAEGKPHPMFELATPEEAQAHLRGEPQKFEEAARA
jgi:hypothetical protein